MNDAIKHKLKHNFNRVLSTVKWIIFSILVGTVVGSCGTLFHFGLSLANVFRQQNPWLLYLLPIAGFMIVGLYHLLRNEKDTGTNLVISAIHSGDELPFQMAPLIFISTLLTHLCGGSAGREGAALQIGGSLGNSLGKLFHFDEKDKKIMIMCGMSAAFSALFGTPMAASIFSLEMISVGIMHYGALVPCVLSSFVAFGIATLFGIAPESFRIAFVPAFGVASATKVTVLAILCGLLSILFCIVLHKIEALYKHYIKNEYLRIGIGGVLVILLTFLVGNTDYNGAGIPIIEACMNGNVVWYAFLLKVIFTAVTLGAGYKGGEIVPSFFIGATFGCLYGQIIGFSPSLCAAVGLISVFCGVTNSPITALLISFELFGFEGTPYFLFATAFSYMCSGYFGLYHTQKIVYSKYRNNFINKTTH